MLNGVLSIVRSLGTKRTKKCHSVLRLEILQNLFVGRITCLPPQRLTPLSTP